jgi:carbon-monoxide dehydrogenase small subunit
LIDDRAVKSCTVLAVQAEATRITTIEGLAQNGKIHHSRKASGRNTAFNAVTARQE